MAELLPKMAGDEHAGMSGNAIPALGSIDALIMAGERPGGDQLAQSLGVAAKAMIPVNGLPMVTRVARTLRANPWLNRVIVVAQNPQPLASFLPDGVVAATSQATIAQTIRPYLAPSGPLSGPPNGRPLLVTTADNPLLSQSMLDDFLGQCAQVDVAIGLVERANLLAHYPDSRRTWLKFRGGAFSGANLFYLAGAKALPLIDVWAGVEQERKRGRALIGAFGPGLLTAVALRTISIDTALDRVGARFGVRIRAVRMTQAEACIDVDRIQDRALVEHILRAREA